MARELTSADEAAERLGITRAELATKARERGWRSFRDGDVLKYLTAEVDALAKEIGPQAQQRTQPLDLAEDETEETAEATPPVVEEEAAPRGEETATEELIFEDTGEEFDVSLLEGEEEKAPAAAPASPGLEDLELADETTETEVEDLASLVEEEGPGAAAQVVEAETEPGAVGEAALEGVEEVAEAAEEQPVVIPSRRIAMPKAAAEHPAFPILLLVAAVALVYVGMFLVNTVAGVNNALTQWTRMLAGGTQ